jgi:hypothetical protein
MMRKIFLELVSNPTQVLSVCPDSVYDMHVTNELRMVTVPVMEAQLPSVE